jgi:hypothetical protein
MGILKQLMARGNEAGRRAVVKRMAAGLYARAACHPHGVDRAGAVAGEHVRRQHGGRIEPGEREGAMRRAR